MREVDRLILEGLLLAKTDLSDEEVERERIWIKKVGKMVRTQRRGKK